MWHGRIEGVYVPARLCDAGLQAGRASSVASLCSVVSPRFPVRLLWSDRQEKGIWHAKTPEVRREEGDQFFGCCCRKSDAEKKGR